VAHEQTSPDAPSDTAVAAIVVVVTHDCARPLASVDQVEAVIAAVLAGADAAITAWQSPDTLKRLRQDGSIEHLGREGILVAQSPIAHRRTTLMKVSRRSTTCPRRDHRCRVDRGACRASTGRSLAAAPSLTSVTSSCSKGSLEDGRRQRERDLGLTPLEPGHYVSCPHESIRPPGQ